VQPFLTVLSFYMVYLRNNKAFTLLELAIVLVLIGLIIGAIIKGSALLDSAKTKKIITALNETNHSVTFYLDRYDQLPGDDPKADKWFGDDAYIGNGDNNITGWWWSNNPNSESYGFWQHLRMANIIKGITDIENQNFLPVNPFGGNYFLETWRPGGANPPDGSYNFIATQIPGDYCLYADRLLDDGNSRTGRVRIYVPHGGIVRNPDANAKYSLYMWFD
jgi:prepilin-type N-terminal cleavage/methylation domain-containing protein